MTVQSNNDGNRIASKSRPEALAQVMQITPYKGGEAKIPGVAAPIKLSSNENPLGASPHAIAAFMAASQHLAIYPDGAALALREAIGRQHGLDPDRIICGAGSDEIFQLLGRAFLAQGDEIVQSQHGFLVYQLVAQAAGARTIFAPETDLCADVDAILACVTEATKIIFLANPNNPTGSMLARGEVERLHRQLRPDILLVLDAAYVEYVDDADFDDGTELARQFDNVLMTRTFSKAYGLAALRLGWGYGAPHLIDAINRVRGPFNVSAPAMLAGIAALDDQAFVARSRAHNNAELKRLLPQITQYGFRTVPSVGNFFLVDFGTPQASQNADQFFRQRGLIFRALQAYGLGRYLRISIGTKSNNDLILRAFAELADVRLPGAV